MQKKLLFVFLIGISLGAASHLSSQTVVPKPTQQDIEPLAQKKRIPVNRIQIQPLKDGPQLWNQHLRLFAELIHGKFGVEVAGRISDADTVVVTGRKDSKLAGEEYQLHVRDNRKIEIVASDIKGLAHGTATLFQMIGSAADLKIAPCRIEDRPACTYRSFMIDLGRNPHSLNCLKQTVDMLWFYKIDSLHLHLTDDQRFAFPSRKFPRLVTEKGRITWEQFAELEKYAQIRGVTLIPELEVPGHSSILRRTYPEVFGRTPTELAKSEKSREAIKVLLDEMIELFPSSPFVHIGGDEAYGVPARLQRELINELHAYLKSKGKKTLVWEGPGPGKGENAVNREVIHLNWRTIEFPVTKMLEAGHPVVNATWDPLYLVDHYPRNNFTMASPEYIHRNLKLNRFKHFNPGIPTFQKPLMVKRTGQLIGFCMPWWEGREEKLF